MEECRCMKRVDLKRLQRNACKETIWLTARIEEEELSSYANEEGSYLNFTADTACV
jgi:hypothetical protein